MNAWVNQHTNPVIMYKPSKNKDLDRSLTGITTIECNTCSKGDSCLSLLKQGGFSAILPDHIPKHLVGIYSSFLD